ncbi:coiled-coil-helix-coiled-coil-helix domain-containing protein 2 [Tropilaelaps mercedesae]|uniref:Coiled-coil-helix-coiled-coil-helix domain-containing protein 2 n=1 Tax=Tropilaelaps mercedesae TaxID=418985 RepID=A0A1V9XMW6_9ACAR|nr:coiled-coil-helix-coiled-coil-helix domain-containing protein 2 [Tropilaelaps mercedesae]
MIGQSRQPGLFGNMASTAAGVAVGHTIGHAITGGLSGGHYTEQPQQQTQQYQPYEQPPQQHQMGEACSFELRQFIECAQNQHDISLCSGFNEVLKACKQRNGIQI